MITERTLKNYRRNALLAHQRVAYLPKEGINTDTLLIKTLCEMIIKLTAELSDIKLVTRGK